MSFPTLPSVSSSSSARSGADNNTFGGFTKITGGLTDKQLYIIAGIAVVLLVIWKRA